MNRYAYGHSQNDFQPILERENEQAEEESRIGRVAAELIVDKETVFLGSGMAVLEVNAICVGTSCYYGCPVWVGR